MDDITASRMQPVNHQHALCSTPSDIPPVEGWRIPLLAGSRWLLPLLLLVTLGLRLALVTQNDIISRDGLNYVGWARMIESGSVQGIPDKYVLNPYPLLIVLVAKTGIDHTLAGQLISAVAATLAILPLFFWCRAAFGQRVAEMAALMYSVHPTLAYVSSEVLREGVYWLLSFSAIAIFWSATRRNCWWRFIVGGLFGVAATLTRVEGVMLFALAAMWWIAQLLPHRKRLLAVAWKPFVAVAALSAVLITTAVMSVPAEDWNKWQLVAMARDYVATHESSQNKMSPAEDPKVWEMMSSRGSLKYLAESLPAHQYRQTRLIDLAKDHLWPLYAADLTYHVTKAFEFPTLVFVCIGIYWGRVRFWYGPRDWPLAFQSLLVLAILLHHLATMHVISTRYAFALLPMVLPWSCLGFFQFNDWLDSKIGEANWKSWVPALRVAAVGLMVIASITRSFHYPRDNKTTERQLGEVIREISDGKETVISGPKKFRRVGFYAESKYTKLMDPPRGNLRDWMDKHAGWLRRQHVDYLLFDRDAIFATTADGGSPDVPKSLRPVFTNDPRFGKMKIYRFHNAPNVADVPEADSRTR